MNYYPPGHAAADPWCYRPDDAGDDTSRFADMIGDYSTDDLFGLEWEQAARGGGASAAAPGSPALPEVRFELPSEEEMAAWLRAIVKGEELAFNDDEQTAAGGRDVPANGSMTMTTTMGKKEKLPMVEEEGMIMGTKQQEMRKTPGGGSSPPRRSHSHHGEAHSLTEKRRRHKINEKFRTLQQLVPGCDKAMHIPNRELATLTTRCNQASTLDQTIQYMKSLQHQVQAMCVGPARPTAAYPVAQAPVVLVPAPTMVPFRAKIQLPHYPAAAVPVMMPAAAAPLYPAAAMAAPVAPAGGARLTASHRQGSSSSKGHGSSRSLRQNSKQGK